MADIDGTGVVDKQEFMIALNSLDEQPSRMHIGLVQRQINVMSREGVVERELCSSSAREKSPDVLVRIRQQHA